MLGMVCGVIDCHEPARGDSDKVEPLELKVIDQGLKDEVRVTVIATGFGPERYRRRRREQRPEEEERGAVRTPSGDEGAFEVPEDVLEVPSFLRDN